MALNLQGLDEDLTLVTDCISLSNELLVKASTQDLNRTKQKIIADIEKDLDAYSKLMSDFMLRLQLICALELGVQQRILDCGSVCEELDPILEKYQQRLDDLTTICDKNITKQCDCELVSKSMFNKLKSNRKLFSAIHENIDFVVQSMSHIDHGNVVSLLEVSKRKIAKIMKDYELVWGSDNGLKDGKNLVLIKKKSIDYTYILYPQPLQASTLL